MSSLIVFIIEKFQFEYRAFLRANAQQSDNSLRHKALFCQNLTQDHFLTTTFNHPPHFHNDPDIPYAEK